MNTKILLISDTVYDSNGVSRFIQDMAAQARRRGEPFFVLSASALAQERPESNILNFRPLWSIRMPFYKEQRLTLIPPLRRMYRHIKAHPPAIIHISTPGPVGLCALIIARMQGIPIAGTYHTDFPSYIRKQTGSAFAAYITLLFMRQFYRRMHTVLSRSKQYATVLQTTIKIPPNDIAFLPPGTDTRHFSPAHRNKVIWRRFGITKHSLKILYVGRLSPEKNFLFVCECFNELQRRCTIPISLIVVGEGALGDAPVCSENTDIHLLGVQRGQTLVQLYASSDMMLFASETETLGQVVMEAQASGLPCIVSDKGGVTDIVIHGQSGYCISVSQKQKWIESALALINDGGLRKRMGEHAFVQMQECTIEKTYETFMRLHQEAVGKVRR